ncbi:hypothetical protein [Plebeiibacterium sediminum]|uniref:Uncharacterized protein n=1 Tax=Plebeiibacterium sediminum TaxID=2992112 RepID=A0AAE3M9I1_9BACT|nr:hypothetical protein [Plebeiobacterium sediminum]MCW3789471.1 hypothetical protein [Plebeiobacterium sediminum]
MLTENQTEALRELLKQGNNAGALALLDGIKNQEPKTEIQRALEIQKEHNKKLNQLKK